MNLITFPGSQINILLANRSLCEKTTDFSFFGKLLMTNLISLSDTRDIISSIIFFSCASQIVFLTFSLTAFIIFPSSKTFNGKGVGSISFIFY
jgi:hypothetical protein